MPLDRIEPFLHVCKWPGHWRCIGLCINICIHAKRIAITVLNGLSNGRKNTDPFGIHRETDHHAEGSILDGKPRDFGINDAVGISEGTLPGAFEKNVII